MIFHEVELQRIKLEPGEVLSVKVTADDLDDEALSMLRAQLTQLFPINQVMVFAMPPGSDIQFQAIQGAKEGCEPRFCVDCNCGKAEANASEQAKNQDINALIAELEKKDG